MNKIHLTRGKRVDTGEWVTGYYCPNDFEPEFEFEAEFNFVDKHGVLLVVDPATVEDVPAKVIHRKHPAGMFCECPSCKEVFGQNSEYTKWILHCYKCGQRLDRE